MRIAVFSPLNPIQSGISDFTEEVVLRLRKYTEIDLFVDGISPTNPEILEKFQIYQIEDIDKPAVREQYDLLLYHIGNNPEHHVKIAEYSLKYPGIVELHDYSLHRMVAGATLDKGKEREYLDIVRACHGEEGERAASMFLQGHGEPLWETDPMKYPLNKHIPENAIGIIVHSKYVKKQIKSLGIKQPIKVIALHSNDIVDDYKELQTTSRRELSIDQEKLIIASFGYATPSKRIEPILEALSLLKRENYDYFYYVVGPLCIEEFYEKIDALGIKGNVYNTAYLELHKFKAYMGACDICMNLRFPVHGESSASLHRALGMGKVAMVSKIASFDEYPDNVVVKIRHDENEVQDIYSELKKIIKNKNNLQERQEKALKFAKKHCDQGKNCSKYMQFLEKFYYKRSKYMLKRFSEACMGIMYKSLRAPYRLLPRSLKLRIRSKMIGILIRLKWSMGFEDPEVLKLYEHYEAKINTQEAVINKYKAYIDTVLQSGKKGDSFTQYQKHDISFNNGDVKPIACYLTQFHEIPENNEWWGKGFTEWTNVTKAVPQFPGHYQPHLPLEGFYDLSDINVMKRQVELAKNYGIYGFMFHYYWFGGKRLLEKPLENFLTEKTGLDFPFCINWANHDWTRIWDASADSVLIKQNHSEEDDLACIADISRYLKDERYIRVNGKPLISIYHPSFLPNPNKTIAIWRDYCRQNGIGEIHIVGMDSNMWDPLIYDFDGAIAQSPHDISLRYVKEESQKITSTNGKTTCILYDMEKYVREKKYLTDGRDKFYKGIMPTFDMTARRDDCIAVFSLTPALYKEWLSDIIQSSKRRFESGNRFVFINAWNEWAEGCHLEPDRRYGFAYLQATADAIMQSQWDIREFKAKIAVQAHIYYVDLAEQIIENLNCIPVPFDCFVSTDCVEKKENLTREFKDKCKATSITVEVFENIGRDMAPLLSQLRDRMDNYDYICHIHTKKSTGRDYDGEEWRKYLYLGLLGSEGNIEEILRLFSSDAALGIIFPKVYPNLPASLWGENKENTRRLLGKLGADIALTDELVFPAGNMFWAKSGAIRNIFELSVGEMDFEHEEDQEDGTLAHAIERHWVYIAQANGYGYKEL